MLGVLSMGGGPGLKPAFRLDPLWGPLPLRCIPYCSALLPWHAGSDRLQQRLQGRSLAVTMAVGRQCRAGTNPLEGGAGRTEQVAGLTVTPKTGVPPAPLEISPLLSGRFPP